MKTTLLTAYKCLAIGLDLIEEGHGDFIILADDIESLKKAKAKFTEEAFNEAKVFKVVLVKAETFT